MLIDFQLSLFLTIATRLSMLRKFFGVASRESNWMPYFSDKTIMILTTPRESSSLKRKSESKFTIGSASSNNSIISSFIFFD